MASVYKLLAILVLMVAFVPAAQAETVTTFNGSAIVNVTVTGSEIVYVGIPGTASVSSASLNITSYGSLDRTQQTNFYVVNRDAFVWKANNNTNYGDHTKLRAGNFTDTSSSINSTYGSYFRFNTSLYNRFVGQVDLIVPFLHDADGTINMYRVYNDTWSELEITFNNRPEISEYVLTSETLSTNVSMSAALLDEYITNETMSGSDTSFFFNSSNYYPYRLEFSSSEEAPTGTRLIIYEYVYPINVSVEEYFNEEGVNLTSAAINLNVTAMNEFLVGCSPDDSGNCYYPINVSGNATIPLNVSLFNLEVEYDDNPLLVLCGGISNTTAINYTFFKEENTSETVRVDVESEFNIFNPDTQEFQNVTFNANNVTSLAICIYPTHYNYTVDSTFQYVSSLGDTPEFSRRYHFFRNAYIDNVTDTITLYLLEDDNTTLVTFTVLDRFTIPQENVIVKATRFFVGEDVYKQVAMGLSDFDGEAVMALKANEWYIFIIEQNGEVLRVYPQKFLTTDAIDLYTSEEGLVEYFEYFDTIAYACTVNNVTQFLTCIFSDTSGKTVQMELLVEERRLVGGFNQVCLNTTTSAAGTLGCSYAGYNNTELRYFLTGSFCCSQPTRMVITVGSIILFGATSFGIVGVLGLLLLAITGIMLGLWNPIVPMITGVIVLVLGMIMGLLIVTPVAMMSLVLAAGIMIYKMRS